MFSRVYVVVNFCFGREYCLHVMTRRGGDAARVVVLVPRLIFFLDLALVSTLWPLGLEHLETSNLHSGLRILPFYAFLVDMGKKRKPLSQAEIWDDSALLQSWDSALTEYKVLEASTFALSVAKPRSSSIIVYMRAASVSKM